MFRTFNKNTDSLQSVQKAWISIVLFMESKYLKVLPLNLLNEPHLASYKRIEKLSAAVTLLLSK